MILAAGGFIAVVVAGKFVLKGLEPMSDEELDEAREKARLDHCAGDENAYGLLQMYDAEIRRRQARVSNEDEEFNYPPHREHGWYLPNDD